MTETIKIDEEEWPTLHQFGPEVSAWGPAAIWRSRIDLSDNFTERIKLRPHQQRGQVTPANAARLPAWHHSCAAFTFRPLPLSYRRSINELFQVVMGKSMRDAPAVRLFAPPLPPPRLHSPQRLHGPLARVGSLFQGPRRMQLNEEANEA